jgi:hypothetical protein
MKKQVRKHRDINYFLKENPDRPTFSTIGICSFCHKEGPLWLRSSFLDYEDHRHRDIVLCYPCTTKYNLKQSALLKSFIRE